MSCKICNYDLRMLNKTYIKNIASWNLKVFKCYINKMVYGNVKRRYLSFILFYNKSYFLFFFSSNTILKKTWTYFNMMIFKIKIKCIFFLVLLFENACASIYVDFMCLSITKAKTANLRFVLGPTCNILEDIMLNVLDFYLKKNKLLICSY